MERKRSKNQNLLLIWNDAVCLIISYFGAYFIGNILMGRRFQAQHVVENFGLVVVSYFLIFLIFNMNDYFMRRNKYEEIAYVIKMNVIVAAVTICVFYFAKEAAFFTRVIWLLMVLLNLVLMTGSHLVIKRILRKLYANGKKNHLLVITSSDVLEKTTQQLHKFNTYSEYMINIAVVDADMAGQTVEGYTVVAGGGDAVDFARRQIVDEVFIALGSHKEELRTYVEQFAEMGIVTHINVSVLEDMEGYSKQLNEIDNFPVISMAPRFFDGNKLLMKRIMDIGGALAGLLITAVVTVFLAPAIKLESKGPLFFKQRRVGKNGRYFYIYKFRSMYADAEARKAELMSKNEMKGLMFKMTDDPRITKVGKFIRATSLDELPQFWNILKGDMSLVGTRPPTVEEFKQYEGRHKRRLSMKPGLTGLWQVSGRSNIEDFEEVVRLDCEYIDKWSIMLDIQIILKTIVVVFKKVGSK